MNTFQASGAKPVESTEVSPEPVAAPVALTGEVVPSEERLTQIEEAKAVDIGPYVESAKTITIENAEDAENAIEVLAELKRMAKSLETERKAMADPINQAKNRVQNFFAKLKAPIEEAESILKPKVVAWQDAEERRVKEANAKAEREQREKLLAEQKRIDEEREAAAAAARKAAEDARAASEKLAAAAEAENEAESAAAEAEALAAADAAREAAEALAAKREEKPEFELAEREEVVSHVQTSRGSGSRKKRWVAEVFDEQSVPREYLMIDQVKINAAVRAGERDIPGVKIFQKSDLAMKV